MLIMESFFNNIPSPVSSLSNDEEIADVFNTFAFEKAGTACGYDDYKDRCCNNC